MKQSLIDALATHPSEQADAVLAAMAFCAAEAGEADQLSDGFTNERFAELPMARQLELFDKASDKVAADYIAAGDHQSGMYCMNDLAEFVRIVAAAFENGFVLCKGDSKEPPKLS